MYVCELSHWRETSTIKTCNPKLIWAEPQNNKKNSSFSPTLSFNTQLVSAKSLGKLIVLGKTFPIPRSKNTPPPPLNLFIQYTHIRKQCSTVSVKHLPFPALRPAADQARPKKKRREQEEIQNVRNRALNQTCQQCSFWVLTAIHLPHFSYPRLLNLVCKWGNGQPKFNFSVYSKALLLLNLHSSTMFLQTLLLIAKYV